MIPEGRLCRGPPILLNSIRRKRNNPLSRTVAPLPDFGPSAWVNCCCRCVCVLSIQIHKSRHWLRRLLKPTCYPPPRPEKFACLILWPKHGAEAFVQTHTLSLPPLRTTHLSPRRQTASRGSVFPAIRIPLTCTPLPIPYKGGVPEPHPSPPNPLLRKSPFFHVACFSIALILTGHEFKEHARTHTFTSKRIHIYTCRCEGICIGMRMCQYVNRSVCMSIHTCDWFRIPSDFFVDKTPPFMEGRNHDTGCGSWILGGLFFHVSSCILITNPPLTSWNSRGWEDSTTGTNISIENRYRYGYRISSSSVYQRFCSSFTDPPEGAVMQRCCSQFPFSIVFVYTYPTRTSSCTGSVQSLSPFPLSPITGIIGMPTRPLLFVTLRRSLCFELDLPLAAVGR